MGDPLWPYLDNQANFNRQDLELVIQKKKLNEVYSWFHEHFVDSSRKAYIERCPIVILQGPTGCGKTATLKWISKELKIPIKEYSETTDLTCNSYDLARTFNQDDNFKSIENLDKRRALKFKHFVYTNMVYDSFELDDSDHDPPKSVIPDKDNCKLVSQRSCHNLGQSTFIQSDPPRHQQQRKDNKSSSKSNTLVQPTCPDKPISSMPDQGYGNSYGPSASQRSCHSLSQSAFRQSDSTRHLNDHKSSSRLGPPAQPIVSGVIIHIETPLAFALNQRQLASTVVHLVELVKNFSRRSIRRVAIVFETLDADSIALPNKVKQKLDIKFFKFNPIIKTNMKKLIEKLVKQYRDIKIDDNSIEFLIKDCDGDMRACINTIQLLCNQSSKDYIDQTGSSLLNDINNINLSTRGPRGEMNHFVVDLPANKRQKVNHPYRSRTKMIELSSSLMRDNTRSLNFFHVLGKIFYQKRFYPIIDPREKITQCKFIEIDRPYARENSTDFLVDLLDCEAKNLISWLHQHYHKFCANWDIAKAALFMEKLSTVDTMSINSLQLSQFYESRQTIDQMQLYLAIESTIYSLYKDNLMNTKSSHKKVQLDSGTMLVKPSVDNSSTSTTTRRSNTAVNPNYSNGKNTSSNGGESGSGHELYSFNKPTSIGINNLIRDYEQMLSISTVQNLSQAATIKVHLDPNRALLDYMPYVTLMAENWSKMPITKRDQNYSDIEYHHPMNYNKRALGLIKECVLVDNVVLAEAMTEVDTRHDDLQKLIEALEEKDGVQQYHEPTEAGAAQQDCCMDL